MATSLRPDNLLRRPRTARFAALLVLLLAGLARGDRADTEATLAGEAACVYPLSGQYGAIGRWVYYALLVFGIAAQREVWLIAGALATALSYSATAAIHALLLAASTPRQPVLDLDLAGAWAVLSAGVFALWPVLSTSRRLYYSHFRPIFALWALLICCGTLAAVAPVYLNYHHEPLCNATDGSGDFMRYPYQVGLPQFNCSYSCFDSRRILRAPSEIQVVPALQAFGDNWSKFKALAAYTVNAGVIIVILSTGLGMRIHRWRLRRKARKDPNFNLEEEEKQAFSFRPKSWGERIGVAAFGMNQMVSIVAVIFNEIYLLGTGLPNEEQPYNISQWGVAVAVALVILAACLNKYIMWREARNGQVDLEGGPMPQHPPPPPQQQQQQHGQPETPESPDAPKDEGEGEAQETKETANDRVVPVRTRVPTMPIREVRTGFFDKLLDFVRFMRAPPLDWPVTGR